MPVLLQYVLVVMLSTSGTLLPLPERVVIMRVRWLVRVITSKIKHAIKLKTTRARLAQLLQPSLAFCFSLQPMTAHWTVRRHWLQATTKCQ